MPQVGSHCASLSVVLWRTRQSVHFNAVANCESGLLRLLGGCLPCRDAHAPKVPAAEQRPHRRVEVVQAVVRCLAVHAHEALAAQFELAEAIIDKLRPGSVRSSKTMSTKPQAVSVSMYSWRVGSSLQKTSALSERSSAGVKVPRAKKSSAYSAPAGLIIAAQLVSRACLSGMWRNVSQLATASNEPGPSPAG